MDSCITKNYFSSIVILPKYHVLLKFLEKYLNDQNIKFNHFMKFRFYALGLQRVT